jgi:hypothetical protein
MPVHLRVGCAVAMLAAPLLCNVGVAQGFIGAGPRATPPAASVFAEMPLASRAAVERLLAAPAGVPGGESGATLSSADGASPAGAVAGGNPDAEAYPHSTQRSSVWALGAPNDASATPVTSYPWRATGKLWAKFSGGWRQCTAALVKRGVAVTAAHCVHKFGKGQAGYASQIQFWPAQYGDTVPYGVWRGRYWIVPPSYFHGGDTCEPGAAGIVCNNDVALVVLHQENGKWAGEVLGFYGYGWNGYGFAANPVWGGRTTAQVAQLGYPEAPEDGKTQFRTDSVATYFGGAGASSRSLKLTVIGSRQSSGADGGPWLVNFGGPGGEGGQAGQAVVGVTSWALGEGGPRLAGASWFGQNFEFPLSAYGSYGAGNIGALMQHVCTHPVVGDAC